MLSSKDFIKQLFELYITLQEVKKGLSCLKNSVATKLWHLPLGLIFEGIRHPLHQRISHRELSSWLAEKPVEQHAHSRQHTDHRRMEIKCRNNSTLEFGPNYNTSFKWHVYIRVQKALGQTTGNGWHLTILTYKNSFMWFNFIKLALI